MPSLRSALMLLAVMVPPTAALVDGAWANPLCGLNSVHCFYGPGTITSSDSLESCSDLYSNARYDLILGNFVLGFAVPPGGDTEDASASVAAVDQYHVEGVPPGTPLVFYAEIDVHLNAYGYACRPVGWSIATSVSATLKEENSNLSSASIRTPIKCSPNGLCCAQAAHLEKTLRVTVTRLAGDLFTLHFDLAGIGRGSGQESGQLRFSGLPPGAFVVSCQGYRQDIPTTAKRTSWGGLKLLYR
jgi:hypothetical protein